MEEVRPRGGAIERRQQADVTGDHVPDLLVAHVEGLDGSMDPLVSAYSIVVEKTDGWLSREGLDPLSALRNALLPRKHGVHCGR